MTTKTLSAAGRASRGNPLKFWVDASTLARLHAIKERCNELLGVAPSHSLTLRLSAISYAVTRPASQPACRPPMQCHPSSMRLPTPASVVRALRLSRVPLPRSTRQWNSASC